MESDTKLKAYYLMFMQLGAYYNKYTFINRHVYFIGLLKGALSHFFLIEKVPSYLTLSLV